MSENVDERELMTIIDFVDRTRGAFGDSLPTMGIDADWAIVRTLMRAHLVSRRVGITELISASRLPYGSGHRRIRRLIELGQIDCRPVHAGAKAVSLTASTRMRRGFEAFAHRIKDQLTQAMATGVTAGDADDYVLGGLRSRTVDIVPPQLLRGRHACGTRGHALKFLFHDDNYFTSLRDVWTDLRSRAGSRRDFTLVGLPRLHESLLRNAALPVSAYDVVSVNFPWVAELASKEILLPMDGTSGMAMSQEVHRMVGDYASWQGQRYGIPLYATVQAFAARRDLFEHAGLPFPKTVKDLLRAAQRLQSAKRAVCGVVWNGARGLPIANSFLFFLHDHGGAVVEPRRSCRSREGVATAWRVVLQSPAARATLKFMRSLLRVSHPDVLDFDGDRTMVEYMAGRAAMAYVWTMRAARFEFDVLSRVNGLSVYLPRPNIGGMRRVAPVGGFMLAVPRNLPPERTALACEAVRWMASSSVTSKHTRQGLPLVPDFGVSSDADLDATSPIVAFVDALAKQDALSASMRPAIPIYHLVEELLGDCIHDALTGRCDDEQALAHASARIVRLLHQMES